MDRTVLSFALHRSAKVSQPRPPSGLCTSKALQSELGFVFVEGTAEEEEEDEEDEEEEEEWKPKSKGCLLFLFVRLGGPRSVLPKGHGRHKIQMSPEAGTFFLLGPLVLGPRGPEPHPGPGARDLRDYVSLSDSSHPPYWTQRRPPLGHWLVIGSVGQAYD
jgi:hypothetical protein